LFPVSKFSSAGIEGGLAQAPGVTKSSDGLAGSLPGGDSVPPELLTAVVAAMDLGHVGGLLIGEKASSIPDLARRPWTGRLHFFCAEGQNLIDLLRARIQSPLKTDPELLSGINSVLEGAGAPEEGRLALRDELIRKFMERLREHFTDAKMPDDKRTVMEKVFTQLMNDATIRTILKDR
jgi:hypothetical protein